MEEQMRMLCGVWKDAWQGMVMAEISWKEGILRGTCQGGTAHPPFGMYGRRGAFYGAPSFPCGEMFAEGTGG